MLNNEQEIREVLKTHYTSMDDLIKHDVVAQRLSTIKPRAKRLVFEDGVCKIDEYHGYGIGTHPYPDDNGNATWWVWLDTTDDDGTKTIEQIGGMNFSSEQEAIDACTEHAEQLAWKLLGVEA